MANIKSAEKRRRQNVVCYARNHSRIGRIRTFIRKVEEAIGSGNQGNALAALKVAEPEIARGVSKGVMHKNTAARTVSRLSRRVKAIA